ncbi:integral membrane protein GPR180 [Aplysia californica]|uniref:Integral membrane protein GPR180 n=1 Tax=Aplysia californica TaxID=6500 RepID=A0ABM0JFP8_APLCA|nr:integral membrane protein GPR180 [Aplysia californica]
MAKTLRPMNNGAALWSGGSIKRLVYVAATLFLWIPSLHCKTVSGVFNTYVAQAGRGQYVTSFAFHGDAVLTFTVNSTGTEANLHLFVSEDWKDAAGDTNCHRRLAKAKELISINETSGSRPVSHYVYPRIWHIVYSDVYTCDTNRPVSPVEKPNFIHYTLQLFNPDSIGNPTEHFGDQETGLLKFYQLLTVIYFAVACVVAPQLYQTLSKGGPMQLVIQLLTFSMSLQAVGVLIFVVHFYRYSHDGVGSPYLELSSEFLDMLSQFAVLFMLLSLSLGWSLASAHSVCRYSHLRDMSRKPAARVVAVLGLVQGLMFMWEQSQDVNRRMYHAQRSYAGISLVLLRILLAAMFAVKLKELIRSERSSLKRQFYSSFTKLCMMWFLCYPFIIVLSWMFSEYLRYKLITMGVLVCQSVAGVLLYRLFLSRSLYWEVSALSSTLPLRFDPRFGMKLYS